MPRTAWQIFQDLYQSVEAQWQSRRSEYTKYIRQVLAEDRVKKPWGAKVNSQHTHTQILSHNAHTQAGLMPSYPWFFARANEPYRWVEPRATEEFNQRLKDLRFYTTMYSFRRLASMYGLGILKQLRGPDGVQQSLVNPADFAWDPASEDIRFDAEWVMERNTKLTWAMVKALRREGFYLASGIAQMEAHMSSARTSRDEAREQRSGTTHGTPTGEESLIELHEVTMPDRIITVHRDSGAVLRDKGNPYGYIYYYDLSAFPEVFEVEGYAIPELLRDIQEEIDTTKRQRIDIISLIANPMFKVRRSSGLDIFGMTARPGAMFPVNDQADMESLQVLNNTFSLSAEEQMLKNEADLITGVMPQTRGERGASSVKATVANITQGNINTRFAVGLALNADYPLQAILDDFIQLAAWDDEPVAVTPQEWQAVRGVVRAGEMRLASHVEAFVGQEVTKAQMLLQVLNVIRPNLLPPGQAIIVKAIGRALRLRDVEKLEQFIIANPEPDPLTGQVGSPNQEQPGIGQNEELARGQAAGQPPMAMGIAQ